MSESAGQFTSVGVKRYWPFAIGGLSAPIGAAVLDRWMPLYVAAGLAMFLAFAAAHWVFQRSLASRVDRRAAVASLVSALAAGVVVGLITYLSPWR